ncbi:Transmembrane 9 superfamily member [Plasmodiophora brassicae]|uniref:Transmembrane 9 superfamily member n=1 Tax=Plasmodiophora brassicae TaxID=37360 RepID=A0A0G4ILN1_PLABS|nr:hypothetical protein PBRA_004724 [Plasmodiophora brassicae]SPQ93420.1 unnamed protein product [Plasmodiophora brassicae]
MSSAAACVLLLLCASATLTSSFYLPGVAPRQFEKGEPIDLKVKELNSVQTQLPYDYYDLPFCRPPEIKHFAENLGEVLSGDSIENSPYEIKMGMPETCKVLCGTPLSRTNAAEAFISKIQEDYRVNWIIDNLPAAMKYKLSPADGTEGQLTEEEATVYEQGFPLGFIGGPDAPQPSVPGEVYINNHVTINLLYHDDPASYKGSRIVGFEVVPLSIRHEYQGEWPSDPVKEKAMKVECHPSKVEAMSLTNAGGASHLIWTYSFEFHPSPIKWASRWDLYLKMTDSKIHWLSIVNSLMIVLFLTGMVAMIMMRTLHRDFRRYNELDQEEDNQQEETGWKLVHGDVFRPPPHGGLFAVLVGSGVQVTLMAVITMFFAVLGFLSPANRGGLMTALVLLFVFMGVAAGYYSARTYKMFGLLEWRKNTLVTALAFPGYNFGVFFVLNLIVWAKHSSGAVPFGTLFALLILWFGISVPLVYLGSYFGYKKPADQLPVKVNQIPRQIPTQSWYMRPAFSLIVGGMLPFGAVFIEVFFIMSSLWLHRFYYMFGFLVIVFVILAITCAEITIVMCYFHLCSEDYQWWWRAFFTSGASAGYLFAYSIMYFATNLKIHEVASTMLFFGYMSLISTAFFLVTGTIGYFATLAFVKKIYGSIKVD